MCVCSERNKINIDKIGQKINPGGGVRVFQNIPTIFSEIYSQVVRSYRKNLNHIFLHSIYKE